MSCCGNKRNEYAGNLSFSNSFHSPAIPSKMPEDVPFEYTGQTGLSITGNITGKKYRFSNNNDIQLIDYRDAGGMMAIPVLRKVKQV